MDSGLTSAPTPLTPPITDEDRLAWLRLIRSPRVGIATFFRLMQAHGSAAAALHALPAIARGAGVSAYAACPAARARDEMEAGVALGARLLCYGDPDYPLALGEIPDPPPVLWALGDITLLSRSCVAVVGARNASSLGLRMAARLAGDLGAAGHVIVSGLARGIDAAAHGAALATGTIAVQAGGIDVLYPQENARLAERIAGCGLRLSEQPPGMEPMARHFPQRNRIISGVARAVVVIEAAAKSGSLLTARAGADQGRDVMAVPGHPLDARASGCNILIRDGATLVRGANDVIAALTPAIHPLRDARAANDVGTTRKTTPAWARGGEVSPRVALNGGGDLSHDILALLGPSPLPEDDLIRDLDRPVREIVTAMVMLELDGAILRHPGGLVSLP